MEPLPEQAEQSKKQRQALTAAVLASGCNLLPDLCGMVAEYIVWDMRFLRIGDVVLTNDFQGTRLLAIVTEIKTALLRVHFIGWPFRYDEWISHFCNRHALAWLAQKHPPSTGHLDGCRCSARPRILEPFYLAPEPEATVITVNSKPATVLAMTLDSGQPIYRVKVGDDHIHVTAATADDPWTHNNVTAVSFGDRFC